MKNPPLPIWKSLALASLLCSPLAAQPTDRLVIGAEAGKGPAIVDPVWTFKDFTNFGNRLANTIVLEGDAAKNPVPTSPRDP